MFFLYFLLEYIIFFRKWNATYAAINALGIDSYYGHLLLKANPKKKSNKKDDFPKLVVASTRTEDGIKDILEKVAFKKITFCFSFSNRGIFRSKLK